MRSDIIKKLNERLNLGQAVVLVTILSTHGSTPRKAGSQMLVFQDGSIFGTVGGGLAEGRSMEVANRMFETKQSCTLNMTMKASVAASEGMACGGDMEFFIQYVGPNGQGQ